MRSERFEHAGRRVRVRYLVCAETVLCAIIDTGEGDIAAILNSRWGATATLQHLMAHLDVGVVGVAICTLACSLA